MHIQIFILISIIFIFIFLLSAKDTTAPEYNYWVESGSVKNKHIRECSGIVMSRKNANVIYANEDSHKGALPGFYAMMWNGENLGEYTMKGARNRDMEDIAIGPGPIPGKTYIYVGDVGDNRRKRSSIQLYWSEEPIIDVASQKNRPVNKTIPCGKLIIKYPDGPHNCESIFIDPIIGDFFLITKAKSVAKLYRIPKNKLVHNTTVTMEYLHKISLRSKCTAADISADGKLIAALSLKPFYVYIFPRQSDETVNQALKKTVPALRLGPSGISGLEAICFDIYYNLYYTQEGKNRPVYQSTVK